jgi:tryptophan-rich sensory protein
MSHSRSGLAGLPRERPVVTLLLVVVLVELVGASGSVFTAQGLVEWYSTLERPALAPPNWVFAPVWTTLFALIGGAVWLIWRRAETRPRRVKTALAVFAVHFAVNLAWSAVFFGQQAIASGLAVILLLLALILATMTVFARVDRRAALLLVPYLVWVSFATYLNYQFWVLN